VKYKQVMLNQPELSSNIFRSRGFSVSIFSEVLLSIYVSSQMINSLISFRNS